MITETAAGLVPQLGESGRAVSELIHALHERSIDTALLELSLPGLTRANLEPILDWCAGLRCEAAGATCPGCRRRTETEGITSLDGFISRHREIVAGDGSVRLEGPGTAMLAVPSIEDLARTWAGEKYWFWARRVHRKLQHGVRRAGIRGDSFNERWSSPVVILMEPQLADNIGMVARAMANFGLDDLCLVNPRDGWPNEKARFAASGANYVIDDAVAHATLPEAIGGLNWLAATTARQRDLRKPVLTPAQTAAELQARIARGERTGILFGRERNGLETDELANADALIMIPVNPRFASLNLAQAVLVVAYEWMRASGNSSLGRVTTFESPISAGLHMGQDRPATKDELLGLFGHLEGELERLGFFNPDHKRTTVVRNLRSMLSRMAPTEQETRTLRGVIATLAEGKGKGRKPRG